MNSTRGPRSCEGLNLRAPIRGQGRLLGVQGVKSLLLTEDHPDAGLPTAAQEAPTRGLSGDCCDERAGGLMLLSGLLTVWPPHGLA